MVGNQVSNNCGLVLDIDTCANFNVTGNTFSSPGNTWGGAYPYCAGMPAVQLMDTNDFMFVDNVVSNNVPSNALGFGHWGDSNHVFSNVGAAAFSDLPQVLMFSFFPDSFILIYFIIIFIKKNICKFFLNFFFFFFFLC